MRLWLGIAVFVFGALLWGWTQRRTGAPPAAKRLGVGVGALGLATMTSTQPGPWWSISTISFSLIAILMLLMVLRDSLRR